MALTKTCHCCLAGEFRKMLLIIPDPNLKQHKAELTAILRDSDDVQQSLELISVQMINPFPDTGNSEFVNIAILKT